MKKKLFTAGMVLFMILVFFACGKIYEKGDLKISLVKVEWNKVFAGPFEVQGGGLVVALNVYSQKAGNMPELPLFVKRASGELIKQGTTVGRQRGQKWVVETFFLLERTDEKLFLIAGDFDPIPLSPVNKL
jgi:hypothetical protein